MELPVPCTHGFRITVPLCLDISRQSQFRRYHHSIQYPVSFSSQGIGDPVMYNVAGTSTFEASLRGSLDPQDQLVLPVLAPSFLAPVPGSVIKQTQFNITAPPPAVPSFVCSWYHLCQASFKRDGDRIRQEASVHIGTRFFCHVQGCPKSYGNGYKRMDRLTKHLWKDHADLGFRKRV